MKLRTQILILTLAVIVSLTVAGLGAQAYSRAVFSGLVQSTCGQQVRNPDECNAVVKYVQVRGYEVTTKDGKWSAE